MDDTIRWDDLAAFLAVARAGGLSAAARETGSSAPTLGRRMRALERATGRDLFARRTHGYDLTEEGARLAAGLEEVAARIARLTAPEPGGALPLVKVSAGTWTTLAITRRLAEIAGSPPDLRLRLISEEAAVSIARRDAVIGLRNRRPTEAGLAGRRIARVEFAPYAAPGGAETWIAVLAETPSAAWVRARSGPSHEASHPRLALDMALAGAGRAVLPTFIGDAEPGLSRAGPLIEELAHDRWLVTHAEDRAFPEVRRALDRIARVLGA